VVNSYYNTYAFISNIDDLDIWNHVMKEKTKSVN